MVDKIKIFKLEARCSSELHSQLVSAAKNENERPSVLIRRFVHAGLNSEGNYIDIQPLVIEVNSISRDMGRVGGNLNQIAHHLNITQKVEQKKLATVLKALRSVQSDLAKALGKIKSQLNFKP